MQQYRLFIGNPGAGKSTLANCIAKRVLFKSGISFGSGKTKKLDKTEHEGIEYLDTPGLADINIRQSAATAITKALKQSGLFCCCTKCRKISTRGRDNNIASSTEYSKYHFC